eukprot:TRINITY_DN21666_c0_g1_i1.p1 TRINITY_DN21666_c0_g1~~TRINITY_DN21666_c0_g1_i1.p1  ORF type:complete len:271 (-),score=46.25 TRINITY_DN21666_c0_g1_i1:18-830(-)
MSLAARATCALPMDGAIVSRRVFLSGWLGLPTPIKESVRVGTTRVVGGTHVQMAGHELADSSGEGEEVEGDREVLPLASTIDWTSGCRHAAAYSNSKLAVLSFSEELERRLRRSPDNEGVTSHAVNPNAITSDFYEKGSAFAYERTSAMAYFPAVWIAGKIYGFINSYVSKAMMRSVDHGAKGIFHVASLKDLESRGGGLFDDTETAFTNCGRKPHFCGRVPLSWIPPDVQDELAAAQLWRMSEALTGLSASDNDDDECNEADGTCQASL